MLRTKSKGFKFVLIVILLILNNSYFIKSSRLPRQKILTGRASHTTVCTGLVYSGSLRCGVIFS